MTTLCRRDTLVLYVNTTLGILQTTPILPEPMLYAMTKSVYRLTDKTPYQLVCRRLVINKVTSAEALRIGYNAMYELLNSHKIKAYKNGRVWRISKIAVTEYILEGIK